jgi:predicted nucleic acid-binding protein
VIVLDANVLIAHLDRNDTLHVLATERMLAVADEQFGASSITLAEVLVAPTRAARLAAARTALHTLGVEELPLPPNASERLAALRAETALKLPDCCVLLTAEAVGGTVLTFDERLAREAARLGLTPPAAAATQPA